MTSFMLDNRTHGNLLRKTELLRDLFQVNRENKNRYSGFERSERNCFLTEKEFRFRMFVM